MKRAKTKKKKNGVKGRKRQKLEAAKAEKSGKFFVPFFKKPASSASTAESEGGQRHSLMSNKVRIVMFAAWNQKATNYIDFSNLMHQNSFQNTILDS